MVLREICGRAREMTPLTIGTAGTQMIAELRQEFARVRRALDGRLGEEPSARTSP